MVLQKLCQRKFFSVICAICMQKDKKRTQTNFRIYFKIYTGYKTADTLLNETIEER